MHDDAFSLGVASIGSWSFTLVPEPGTAGLLAGGLLGLSAFARRRSARRRGLPSGHTGKRRS